MPSRLVSLVGVLGLTTAFVFADEHDLNESLQSLQGTWRLVSVQSGVHELPTGGATGESIEERMSMLYIERTSLTIGDSKSPITMECSSGQEGFEPPPGTHLAMLTYSDGQVVAANYRIEDDQLILMYPYSATCSRSGMRAIFRRVHE